MDQQVTERRSDARFAPPSPAGHATLRPGCVVALIDVSAGGALVEGARPIRPGARVQLQVATAARRYSISAQVLRCTVWALDPLGGVTYRGALKFDERVEWGWAHVTRGGHDVPEPAGAGSRSGGQQLPVKRRPGTTCP